MTIRYQDHVCTIDNNNHVIQGTEAVQAVLNDTQQYAATIIGNDPDTDLAVLKITASSLPIITFGQSDQLQVGDVVLAT